MGLIPAGRELAARQVAMGDVVLASGTMGDHGTAVMLARGDLALEADIESDTAPLHGLVEDLLAAAPDTRWLRDSTRGGVGTVCNELARDADLTVVLEESSLPGAARGGGRLRAAGDRSRSTWPTRESSSPSCRPTRPTRPSPPCAPIPWGREAVRIGEIHAEPPGIVVLRTSMGGTRIVDMLVGDPLPRIC